MAATKQGFTTKIDFFGLAGDALKITSSNDGRTQSVAEAKDANGDIVAWNEYGERLAPSCDFALKAKWSDTVKLGASTEATVGGDIWHCYLTSVSVNTSAGAAPTVSASGEAFSGDLDDAREITVGAFACDFLHHAQALLSAFTFANGYLQSANYTASCDLTKAEVNGEVVAVDASNGRIECQITIAATSGVPTLTPADGWAVTSPLACSNPDSDYPSYTATIVKYLSVTAPAAA